jgi:hypothetical protein
VEKQSTYSVVYDPWCRGPRGSSHISLSFVDKGGCLYSSLSDHLIFTLHISHYRALKLLPFFSLFLKCYQIGLHTFNFCLFPQTQQNSGSIFYTSVIQTFYIAYRQRVPTHTCSEHIMAVCLCQQHEEMLLSMGGWIARQMD